MATLRSFIALLLVGQWLERDLAGKPGPTFPDRTQKPGILEGTWCPKRKPGQTTGQTLLVAAQYSQKSPKNNILSAKYISISGTFAGFDRVSAQTLNAAADAGPAR
jgi:hypothetical protein